MPAEDFKAYYGQLTDGELAKIVSSRRTLVPEARVCLDEEIARRGLTPEDLKRFRNARHDYRRDQSPLQRKIRRSKVLARVNDLRKMPRLGWRGILGGIVCTFVMAAIFDYFGVLDLTLPVCNSALVLFFILRSHWGLKRRVWFWGVVAVWIAMHVWIIVRVHWPSRWVPARVWSGYATIDLIVIFVVIALIEKLLHEGRFAKTGRRAQA
jgi:hypothetical protein